VSETRFPQGKDELVDPLTGVASRVGFERRLSVEWRRARRNGNSLGLLIVDLDDPDDVVRRSDRTAAEEVLRKVAGTIAETVREDDLVARFDGNEFVVVTPETTANGLRQLAGELTKSFTERGLEVSIGRAELESGDRTPADVVARADVSMHQQKERKRTVRQGEHRRRKTTRGAVDAQKL
jgi:diguanylate cyclase (GGDEF)-like protein